MKLRCSDGRSFKGEVMHDQILDLDRCRSWPQAGNRQSDGVSATALKAIYRSFADTLVGNALVLCQCGCRESKDRKKSAKRGHAKSLQSVKAERPACFVQRCR